MHGKIGGNENAADDGRSMHGAATTAKSKATRKLLLDGAISRRPGFGMSMN
jgi:hypothetical protein